MTVLENPPTPDPLAGLKQLSRKKFTEMPNFLYWDLPADHRQEYYAREVLPALSPQAEEIRKSNRYDVTFHLRKAMGEIPENAVESAQVSRRQRPAFRSATLTRKSGYFVILRNGEFNYYRCLVEPSGEHLFRMKEASPILSEGVYILEKKIYFVTEQDLRRGLVRKARELTLKRSAISYADILTNNVFPATKSGAASAGPGTSAISGVPAATPGTNQDPDDTGSMSASELAELQAINLAFDEQVRELLGASSQEEVEWQASENP